jgi:hypothetical protein
MAMAWSFPLYFTSWNGTFRCDMGLLQLPPCGHQLRQVLRWLFSSE